MEQENNDKVADSSAEPSTLLQSKEKDDKAGENSAETSKVAAQASKQETPKTLRWRTKIVKRAAAGNSGKAKEVKGAQPVLRKNSKKRKNKWVVQGNKEDMSSENQDAKDGKPREDEVPENFVNVEHTENGKENQSNENEVNAERIASQTPVDGKENQVDEERIAAQRTANGKENQVNKETNSISRRKGRKRRRNDDNKHGRRDQGLRIETNKGKIEAQGRSRHDENKKERLGGLIFMCSAKTKPDCFRYRVMGVTLNKKDVVLAVKPGLKLFLYDFDLKLMYGIYEASSSGGMKLEPKAFGGSFPVQVRFRVYKDCFPIPESAFKKAIKENYDRKNKFSTELTVRQATKLSELFRPAALQSARVPVHSSSTAAVRDKERLERVREPALHSEREAFVRVNHDVRSFPVLTRDRDQYIDYREGSIRREEIPRDLFMSERGYRTYGLRGERSNISPPKHITSTLDPYQRDQEREHLIRRADPIYRDTVSVQREAVVSPRYLNQREFQAYNPSTRGELRAVAPPASATAGSAVIALDSYTRDPYNYHYGASSSSTYLPPTRRDEVSTSSYYVDGKSSYLVASDSLHRGETDHVNRLYSTYAPDAPSSYNQVHGYDLANHETAAPPVSSRYSYADPSVIYR